MYTLYFIAAFLGSYFFFTNGTILEKGTPCYDEHGTPQRCIPQFENAAFGLEVEATNTCGEKRVIDYCWQTSPQRDVNDQCNICKYPDHSPVYLTDYNAANMTWWQSETMFENKNAFFNVNLTLHFGKAFDLTNIIIHFVSLRPHSFAIYKKTSEEGQWIPIQYYSAECVRMYNRSDQNHVLKGDAETVALCTSEYSDVVPVGGGPVPFSTLEGRPSAYQYDYRPDLWEWVTMTDIRISLNRLNTFGNEIFNEQLAWKSYYYAIADINVGARCKCNGHASECLKSYADGKLRRVCRCEHNTAGPDCNTCLPFYNDVPWKRASTDDANVCQPCNCNGYSKRCFFDKELYEKTGHGGHCVECANNRDGPNCERCRQNYYQPSNVTYCAPCDCNPTGSWSLQCNGEGRCHCKAGVTGDKCDRCDANYYDFSITGCKACGCDRAGSRTNQPSCDTRTGVCACKDNVEGKQCSSCKPGFFNLDENNEFGCTPCFCYGHSSVCHSSPGYSSVVIENAFSRGNERWAMQESGGSHTQLANYNGQSQSLEVAAASADPVYFLASERYLGDQRASYNRDLSFKLRTTDTSTQPSPRDVILEGGGLMVSQSIFGQGNPLPTNVIRPYKFRLHEHPKFGWQPRLSARDFMRLLSNLTSIKIRGTYTARGIGYLDDVALETARRGAAGFGATWVETCVCPDSYVGQFCEQCAPGSRHDPSTTSVANLQAFGTCVPCNCNQHAKICDPDSGRCICEHNTGGENCERCARGFYGDALKGTPDDCKPCPCPDRGACLQAGETDEDVVCLQCPQGYGGARCDSCSDGYYGDPLGKLGSSSVCRPCDCSGNVDPNAIRNCDQNNGKCLKCIYNTAGPRCDQCLPGYYGDALAVPKGDCKRCQCYPPGTEDMDDENGIPVVACNQLSGQCLCKNFVTGLNCDRCQPGYWNVAGGRGCEPCQCDGIGSLNATCDEATGQCYCQPGITGLRCDVCEVYRYGFSSSGCLACECDPIGSMSPQCDSNGQCACLENVEGRRCDRCKENKYDKARNCVDCPSCYNLVKDAADAHRKQLADMRSLVANISDSPNIVNDENFESTLKQVSESVSELEETARNESPNIDGGGRLADLRKSLAEIGAMTADAQDSTNKAAEIAKVALANTTAVDEAIDQSQRLLQSAADYLKTEGSAALAKAVKKSEEVGEQSDEMSKIAKEARDIVQEQETEADEVRSTAERALNVSTDAYNAARDAIQQQLSVGEELQRLDSRLAYSAAQLNATTDRATATLARVNKTHDDALSLYSDIYGMSLPDISQIKATNYTSITQTAEAVKNATDKLVADNEPLLADVERQLAEAEQLLSRSAIQQRIMDELHEDAQLANKNADEAVKLGDTTLKEAQQTYDTLQAFDKQVQDSKDKSLESVKEIPEVEKLIEEAKEATKTAEQSLAGAREDAILALETAKRVHSSDALLASEKTKKLDEEVSDTLQEATRIREEAESLRKPVEETATVVDQLAEKATKDQATVNLAKEKVGQAKTNAADVRRQVEKASEEVMKIARQLANLPDVDEDMLNDLSKKLEAAEKEFEDAKIDEQIQALNSARLAQAQQIKQYEEELAALRAEVDNLSEISEALPKGCWKSANLEP